MVNDIKILLDEGKNYSEIAKQLNIHRTTVSKICNRNNFSITRKQNIRCSICSNELKNNVKNHSRCGTCVTRLRRLRLKKKSVEYKGSSCERCGYNKHLAALTFHHLDPSKKEFNISNSSKTIPWDILKKELDKCILLCSNCHQIEHSKYDDENLIKYL